MGHSRPVTGLLYLYLYLYSLYILQTYEDFYIPKARINTLNIYQALGVNFSYKFTCVVATELTILERLHHVFQNTCA